MVSKTRKQIHDTLTHVAMGNSRNAQKRVTLLSREMFCLKAEDYS